MGSRDKDPPLGWEDLIVFAEEEKLTPLDVGRLIHRHKYPEIKMHMEVLMIYGILHRHLETIKPKIIKSNNYKWFMKPMPKGTKVKMEGRTYNSKPWRTNETYIHFIIALMESERTGEVKGIFSRLYDEYRAKYNLKPTSNIVKTLTRGYSEAYLDSRKRDLIHKWSIPIHNPPQLRK